MNAFGAVITNVPRVFSKLEGYQRPRTQNILLQYNDALCAVKLLDALKKPKTEVLGFEDFSWGL